MSYTPKPGSGALFRNDKKKDTHPDYKGSVCLPDGSTMQLAGWVKTGASGKYLSLTISQFLPPVKDQPE
jgi:hypothetical protein